MVRATAGRCPNCGEGGVFVSLYGVRPTCRRCGVRFERDPGAWLGAMVVAYALAVVVVVLVAVVAIVRSGLFPGLEWWLVGVGFATVALAYRPAKGWWLWWMWAAGFVTRDGDGPATAAPSAAPPGTTSAMPDPTDARSGPSGATRAPDGDEQHADDGERHQR